MTTPDDTTGKRANDMSEAPEMDVGRPDDIPLTIWKAAAVGVALRSKRQELIARAIMTERARWQPSVTYFNRYCLDEAEDVEDCVAGQQQHDDAKAFAAVIRATP